jgi:hypothetical protein
MKKTPPFKLVMEPMTEEASKLPKYEWADEEMGTRHQLGGEPEYMDVNEYPSCNDCGERMTFYAQLDSVNDEFDIADCGMIYVFICFDCFETKSIIHGY